jgi:hypothetical protein
MADELANVTLTNVTALIAAVGGLGTAAYGLVDASKAVGGGMSNPGFGYVSEAIAPLLVGAGEAPGFGQKEMLTTLRANWLNGVPKADQKAIAKSLVHLGLTPGNALGLAKATGIDGGRLAVAATKVRAGQALDPQDVNILGEFDAIVSAILDSGYERADQFYRNWAKLVAAVVAIVLALVGGWIISQEEGKPYLGSARMWFAILVGLLSTPLAPVAKDLSSSLSAAVKAVNGAKR